MQSGMYTMICRDADDGLRQGFDLLQREGAPSTSRAGDVLTLGAPLCVTYCNPTHRVLLDPHRDANPFFHLFESLWLIAGRQDARWLDQFVGDFSSRFAEEDGKLHGSYGFRWRRHFGQDQLEGVIKLLRENPDDRRVVLQMWDPRSDLDRVYRDVPCNLVVVPRLLTEGPADSGNRLPLAFHRLDLTVFNRSNDICWGMFGANAVQFSMLQEYLAGRIGVQVGRYYQISTNAHLYKAHEASLSPTLHRREYPGAQPIGTHWRDWDEDLYRFMRWSDDWSPASPVFSNAWFAKTAAPLYSVHRLWKLGRPNHARERLRDWSEDMAPDWACAAAEWMDRRLPRLKAAREG